MISLPVLMGYLSFPFHWTVFWISLIAGAYLGYRLAWWYWAQQITRWRIQAFSAVSEDDWLMLHRAAVRNKLLWPNGHPSNIYEHRSEEAAEFLTNVEERLAELRQVEEINDDFITAGHIDIKVKTVEVIMMFGVYIFPLVVGVAELGSIGSPPFFALLFIAFGLYGIYQQLPYLISIFKRQPLLSLRPDTIDYWQHQTKSVSWQDVTELSIRGEFATLFIAYNVGEDVESFEIDLSYLATGGEEKFRRLLKTFAKRHCR